MQPQVWTEEGSGRRRLLYSLVLETGAQHVHKEKERHQGAQEAEGRSRADTGYDFTGVSVGKARLGWVDSQDWLF